MLDPDVIPAIRDAIRSCTSGDARLLDDLRADVRRMAPSVRPIRPRRSTSVSVVASDGGNNRLEFDPFMVQLVRVVDSYGKQFLLDAVSPTADPDAAAARHLGASAEDATALGRMMRDLGVATLHDLSPMIPTSRRVREDPDSVSTSWVQVYRDLCEWAVLYERVVRSEFATDTLLVRDGLLRSKIFSGSLFTQLGRRMADAIERVRREQRRRVFLVGVAKRSGVLERYRMAMLVENTLPPGEPRFVRVPRELERKVYRWPEYARAEGETEEGVSEEAKFVLGALHFVRFGPRDGDPVWPVDVFTPQVGEADEVLGHLLADAVEGFPVPRYPMCLQRAHEHAQVVDFDLTILQDEVIAAVRELLPARRRDALDRLILREDVARLRYG